MARPTVLGTSYGSRPAAIISPQYCVPNPIDLSIVRRVVIMGGSSFDVKDTNGNTIFMVEEKIVPLGTGWMIMFDPAGNIIVTLKRKVLTDQWRVFRGDSRDKRDLICTVKRHSFFTQSIFSPKKKLDVFLANNTAEEVCDFKIKASLNDWSCTIFAGDDNTVVAQMDKKLTAQSIFLGKDNFRVTIYPNIDYAFIAALILIMDDF